MIQGKDPGTRKYHFQLSEQLDQNEESKWILKEDRQLKG